MVVLSELTSVFWGVALEGGKKKYTQTTKRPVHISMAALDLAQTEDTGPLSVMIEHGTGSYVLCTLQRGVLFQQPLSLEFAAGEELSFYINGNGTVHLSGYFMPEDDFSQYSDENDDEETSEEEMVSDEEEDNVVSKTGKKRNNQVANKKSKKPKLAFEDLDDEDDDDSDDEDFIIDEAEEVSDDDDDDDEDEMLEEESDSDAEELPKPVTKKNKQTPSKVAVVNADRDKAKNASTTPSADASKIKVQNEKNKPTQQTPTESQPQKAGDTAVAAEGKKKKRKKKKNKNKNQGENQQQASSSAAETTAAASTSPAASKPTKRVAEGGVIIEDLKQGHGPEAKIGKMVRVYYTGRLANGKVFDACSSGNGFKFKLGKREVISGWDVGLSGMKVGGKRKLVIPPKMGYGSQSAGPIPANSTLHFEVELKAVG